MITQLNAVHSNECCAVCDLHCCQGCLLNHNIRKYRCCPALLCSASMSCTGQASLITDPPPICSTGLSNKNYLSFGHDTHDMWHLTCDMWHATCDMWHLTNRGWLMLSQKFSSLALTVWDFSRSGGKGWVSDSMNQRQSCLYTGSVNNLEDEVLYTKSQKEEINMFLKLVIYSINNQI